MTDNKNRVCITGATGFVGSHLLEALAECPDLEVTALSRRIDRVVDGAVKGNVTWKRCNGFYLEDVERATAGADVVVYLIHSMLPTSTLTQGSFADFDLFMADNFARAAKKNGVKRIVYLSGLMPKDTVLSEHLKSRLEVERALAAHGCPTTSLRAGLIVGKNSSSFKILERLIKRLPALICPSWTEAKIQPIEIADVLASMIYTIRNHEDLEPTYDLGGPDVMTYKEMLAITAEVLAKRRPMLNVPVFSPHLSKLWVSKVTTTASDLVYPLIDSLKHDMIADPGRQLILKDHEYTTFRQSLQRGANPRDRTIFQEFVNYKASVNVRWLENATSIQRINNCERCDPKEVVPEYFGFLERLRPLIRIDTKGYETTFKLKGGLTLLRLVKMGEDDDSRSTYKVAGGSLARDAGGGHFIFSRAPASKCVLIALLDFQPSLPWFVYKYTQALVHLWVMRSFERHMSAKAAPLPASES